jgi:heme o synthase
MPGKVSDYSSFVKLRLSLLVVFSAAMGYLFAEHPAGIDWTAFTILIASGFLVTGASNGFNQLIEKDLDKLMSRTAGRPLPGERMSPREGLILSIVMGLGGILLLTLKINPLSGFLGTFALASYTFIYTPLKRITPFAVFVGALPGAIPPMLGYVAATGEIDLNAILLFSIQFIWQFPHFWAIAWVLDDDYKKAGFKMLPTGQRDKSSAFQTMVYSFGLIPISLLPLLFHRIDLISTAVIVLCGILFFIQSLRLFRECSIKSASTLMFSSFIYLPVVQIAMVLGKIE